MNRFKRELRKRGYLLECDYESLPYRGIETVYCNAEKRCLDVYHDGAGWMCSTFDRQLKLIDDTGTH